MGEPLDSLRVHDDSAAAHATESLGAEAYTVGEHLVFGRDRFRPESREGRALVAHEAAHAVQQRKGKAGPALKKKKAGAGGTTSWTTPSYTIADVEKELAKLNKGPLGGGVLLKQLKASHWKVRFWNTRGRDGVARASIKTVLLPPEGKRVANVSTLFHEAIHVTRPIKGALGAVTNPATIWAHLEDEIGAQLAELRFLMAHAASHPKLIAASSFGTADVTKLSKMTRSQVLTWFQNQAVLDTILGHASEYGVVLKTFGGDIGKMAASPKAVAMLNRVFQRYWPAPTLKPPTHKRQKAPSLIKLRTDFRDKLLQSVDDL